MIPGRVPTGLLWRPPPPKPRRPGPAIARVVLTALVLAGAAAFARDTMTAAGLTIIDRWTHSVIAGLIAASAIVGIWWGRR